MEQPRGLTTPTSSAQTEDSFCDNQPKFDHSQPVAVYEDHSSSRGTEAEDPDLWGLTADDTEINIALAQPEPLFMVPVTLHGEALKGLVDTGASQSLIQERFVSRLKLPQQPCITGDI